jgi:predicted aspartyl protease
MKKIASGFVALLLLSQIVLAGAPADADQRALHDEIPFELVFGYLAVLNGSIGSLHGLKFILDTGSTHSVVSRKIADGLALSRSAGKVINVEKSVTTEWAMLPELEVGPVRAKQVPVMVMDLDYFHSLGTHVDGVIGLDLLRQNSFSIDFTDHRVRFGRMAAGRHSVPMQSDQESLKVEVHVNGQPTHMILDSGAPGPMFYEDRLESRAVDYRLQEEDYAFRMNGLFRMKRAKLQRVQLGGRAIENTVFLTPSPAKGFLQGIDGLLGLASLKARRINFDFETNTLSWTN